MTIAEILQHIIDMSSDGHEAISDLRLMGYIILPIEPDDAVIARIRVALATDGELPMSDETRDRFEQISRAAYAAVVKEG